MPGRRVEADHDAVSVPDAGRLWDRAATRIGSATGWSLSLVGRAGSAADDRRTWLAEADFGPAVVKAVTNPFAGERVAWAAAALPVLAGRGYPVPEVVWHGRLDERWFLVVQTRLPGQPLDSLGPATLEDLLALVERQAGLGPVLGGWDVSWWLSVVLFDGWEDWWDISEDVAPKTTRRLRQFIEPAWGHRLPAADLVHHDLNLSNVLARDGAITGVVDWDDAGAGSRATDLACLLFEWHRLRLEARTEAAAEGGQTIAARIAAIAGDDGLRCSITYAAIANLALSAQRGDVRELETWRQVTEEVLDSHAP
jgi:aminoglycoside phosphotransferase